MGQNSYMDWHRDAFIMNNKVLGRFPPPIKLMYYPALSENECNVPRLKLIPNSHIIQIHSDQNYTSRYGAPINSLDNQLVMGMKKEIINSSNDEYVLFNTAMLHGAAQTKINDKAFRVIYSLILEDQFEDVCDELHLKTKNYYNSL